LVGFDVTNQINVRIPKRKRVIAMTRDTCSKRNIYLAELREQSLRINHEARMSNVHGITNAQIVGRLCQTPRRFAETPYNDPGFVILSAFVICR